MKELELNLMEVYPDETWTMLYGDTISGPESIDPTSKIAQCINLLNEINISYVSYFSDNMSGEKHPKYTNSFTLFVKTDDFEYIQKHLMESGVLFDKTIEEIEEFKDVDINEELTYQSLSPFNKALDTIFSVCGLLFLWGMTIIFIYLSTQVSNGKVGSIIVTTILVLVSLIYTKKTFFTDKK